MFEAKALIEKKVVEADKSVLTFIGDYQDFNHLPVGETMKITFEVIPGIEQQGLDFDGEKDAEGPGDDLVKAPATTDGPMPPKPESLKGINEEEQQVVDVLMKLCASGGPGAEVTVSARAVAPVLGWEGKAGADKARRLLNKLALAGEVKKNADGQFYIIKTKGEKQ